MDQTKIRLVLADDHPALIAGIKHELSAIPTLDIVGVARNSTELIDVLSKVACDMIVTDYAMPGGQFGDGMSLISFLRRRYPAINIVVFTMLDNVALAREMSSIGVRAVLSKMDDPRHLVSAILAVGNGGVYFPTSSSSKVNPIVADDKSNMLSQLTRREAEVLRLYVSGQTIQEIAKQLHRSKQTISAQKMSAMRKIGIERDADLFRFAYEVKMLSEIDLADRPDSV